MPAPKRGSVKLVSGATTLEVMVKNWQRYQAAPLQPITNPTGVQDYNYANPVEGITESFEDFSRGAGAFLHSPGRYALTLNGDARRRGYVTPGPRQEADVTGIAANQIVIGAVRHSEVNWVITRPAAGGSGKAYRIEAGVWAEKRDFAAVAPTCIVSFKGVLAIGLGGATAFDFTSNDGTTWTASTKIGNAKFMSKALVAQNAQTSPRVVYTRDPNEAYTMEDMTNAGASTTSSTVGDTVQDEFNNIAEDSNGSIYFFKRRYIHTMDSDGNVRTVAGPFKYYATSDSGATLGGANGKYVVNIEGRIYAGPIEDYFILEIDHGLLQFIEPGVYGSQIPRMQMPINAMAKVGRELWVAMGSINSATLKDVTQSPAGNALLGNVFSTKSELWAGRYVDFSDGNPPTWVWHGILLQCSDMVGAMWYDDGANYLMLANSENAAINLSQRRAYVTTVDPLGSATAGIVKLSRAEWELELGLFTAFTPNITKLARRQETRARGLDATHTLALKHRVAEDDVNTAFSTLATYTSNATARTGTAYPASSNFRGIRIRFVGSVVTDDTYVILFNSQTMYLSYPPIRDIFEFDIVGVRGQRQHSGALSSLSLKQIRTAVDAFKDQTDVITLTDMETGDAYSVRMEPEPGGFGEVGDGKRRAFHLKFHEVV